MKELAGIPGPSERELRVLALHQDTCKATKDCATGLMRCEGGKCQESKICWSDNDCLKDRVCQRGQCVDEPVGCRSQDCPPNHTCNSEFGECEAHPCEDDSQCAGPRRCSPQAKTCARCLEDSDCGAGNICYSYNCQPALPKGCRGSGDCEKGSSCHEKRRVCIKHDSCQDDNMEDNDSAAQAVEVEPGEYQLHQCYEDNDWFKINVQAGESLLITTTYPQGDGFIELQVTNAKGGELQRTGDTYAEGYVALGIESFEEDTTVVFVVKNRGGTGMPYTLNVQRGFQKFCKEDRWEPNDMMEEAVQRPANIYYSMHLCDGRDDWYKTEIDAGQDFLVNIETIGGQAPLVEIYEEGTAERVAFDFSTEKAKIVQYKTRKAGTHYVRLFPRYLDDTSSYGLRLKHAKYVR